MQNRARIAGLVVAGLAAVGTAASIAEAAVVSVTVPANSAALWIDGVQLAAGTSNVTFTDNVTHTLKVNISDASGGAGGTFTVNNAGVITTSAPGFNTTGGPGTLGFNTSPLTISRGAGATAYDGTFWWHFVNLASSGDTREIPLGTGNMQFIWGNATDAATNEFRVSTNNTGAISVSAPNAGIYSFNVTGSTVTFPASAPRAVFQSDVPGWGIAFITANAGSTNTFFDVMPGKWAVVNSAGGFAPGGTWAGGLSTFTIPLSPAGYSQTLSYTLDGQTHFLSLFVPEPSALGMLAAGGLALMQRRRRHP